MKRQVMKFTAIAMASLMAVGTFTPPLTTLAAEDVHTVPYSEFSQDGGSSRDTIVTWDNDGSDNIDYDGTVVIIPKNLPLGKNTKSADYNINVKGAIPYDKKVTVVPRDEISDIEGTNFYMKDQNPLEALRKSDVPATVVQEDTEWSVDEVTAEGTVKNGNVSAPGLTFGTWEGILTFDINTENTDGSHPHNFVDGMCTKCGLSEGSGSGNNSGSEENPPEHTHNYTETITKEPTCTETGEKTLTCDCGDVKTETIPATEHNYVNGACTNCGKKDPDAAHEHSYTAKIILEPTCTEKGVIQYVCKCGDSYTEKTDLLPHSYGEDGICTGCGDVHEHTYQESVSQEGSCTTDRIITHTCECGDSYTENLGKYHTFDDAGFCTSCGQADMSIYTTPGLYGLSNGKPVFRTAYLDLLSESTVPISTDLSAISVQYEESILYAITHSATANPYGEKFILYLPDEVTKIGKAQFYNYGNNADPNGLMYGLIAHGVTDIGANAFNANVSGKTNYQYFSFSHNLKSIGKEAFKGQLYIYKLHIPNSVTYIGANAFNAVGTLYYSGSAPGSPWGASKHIKSW